MARCDDLGLLMSIPAPFRCSRLQQQQNQWMGGLIVWKNMFSNYKIKCMTRYVYAYLFAVLVAVYFAFATITYSTSKCQLSPYNG
jgi:hypothetical protein